MVDLRAPHSDDHGKPDQELALQDRVWVEIFMIEQKIAKTVDEMESLMKDGWLFKSAVGAVAVMERERPEPESDPEPVKFGPPEFTEDEILFYSTPYFDELQARKKAITEQRQIDEDLRRSHG